MKLLKYLFTFRGYIGRLDYLLNIVIAVLVFFVFIVISQAAPIGDNVANIFVAAAFLTFFCVFLLASIKRCRNIGLQPWWLILFFIPYLNAGVFLILLFLPGWTKNGGGFHLFSLLKIIAESEGKISPNEIKVFMDFCNTNMDANVEKIAVAQFVKGAKNPFFGFDYHLSRYHKESTPDQKQAALNLMRTMARANGAVSSVNLVLIQRATKTLGINDSNATPLPPGFKDLVGMAAKLAKADGVITKDEIAVLTHFFEDIVQLDSVQKKVAVKQFNEAKTSPITFTAYAKNFEKIHRDNQNLLSSTFQFLVEVALADDEITSEEADLLDEAARTFGIQHESNGEKNKSNDTLNTKNETYYEHILGLEGNYGLDDVLEQYKRLINKNHPDKVATLSDVIREAAEQEAKKLNEARDYFKKKYA